jgi:hypothetical protein
MTSNRRLIGHVAVDIGTIAIVDPRNADAIDDVFTKMIDDRAHTISLDGLVISDVGLGDGFYPAFVETAELDDTFKGERVTKIIIDCGVTDTQRKFLERERQQAGDSQSSPPGS